MIVAVSFVGGVCEANGHPASSGTATDRLFPTLWRPAIREPSSPSAGRFRATGRGGGRIRVSPGSDRRFQCSAEKRDRSRLSLCDDLEPTSSKLERIRVSGFLSK